jgi:hypothetical protein
MYKFIRIGASQKADASAHAQVKRGTDALWPIDVVVAGTLLSMSDAGARELVEKLQSVLGGAA